MRFRWLVSVLFALFPIGLSAQKVKTVSGSYEYHAPKNISMEEAERIALERAKLQAIADEFGTLVSQSNFTSVSNRNGESDVDFFSLGGSETKGEWIETLGKPQFNRSFDEDGSLIIRVTVRGRIREVNRAQIAIEAKVLCNGTDLKFERSDFRNGDDLYLYFKSPVDGYLNVYLLDEATKSVFCLLPYRKSRQGAVFVEHDEDYLFFSKKAAGVYSSEVDEYVMTCSRNMERNILYVMFSPNEFAKSSLEKSPNTRPHQITWIDFQKWIKRNRSRDDDFNVKAIEITIKK